MTGTVSARGTVGLVHQHFELIGRLRVWQNVLLGREPHRGWRIDESAARERVRCRRATQRPGDRPECVRRNVADRRATARRTSARTRPRPGGPVARRADRRAGSGGDRKLLRDDRPTGCARDRDHDRHPQIAGSDGLRDAGDRDAPRQGRRAHVDRRDRASMRSRARWSAANFPRLRSAPIRS